MYQTADDFDLALQDMIRWSRPASTSARYVAINYGYRECCRAVTQVRPEHFLQETIIQLPANLYRVPLLGYNLRPIQRIKMIQVFDPGSANLVQGNPDPIPVANSYSIRFQYASVESDRFQASQAAAGYASTIVFYDLLYPIIQVDAVLAPVPTLALAPALAQDTTILMETVYFPLDFVNATDLVEPIIARNGEAVLCFAMYWLLQQVNDLEARSWQAEGVGKLSLIRDTVAQVSGQNTEFLDTGLAFGDETY